MKHHIALLICVVIFTTTSANYYDGIKDTDGCARNATTLNNITFPNCEIITTSMIQGTCSETRDMELLVSSSFLAPSSVVLCTAPYPMEVDVGSSDPNFKSEVTVMYSRKLPDDLIWKPMWMNITFPRGSFQATLAFLMRETNLKTFTVKKVGEPSVNVTIVELRNCLTSPYTLVEETANVQASNPNHTSIPCADMCVIFNDYAIDNGTNVTLPDLGRISVIPVSLNEERGSVIRNTFLRISSIPTISVPNNKRIMDINIKIPKKRFFDCVYDYQFNGTHLYQFSQGPRFSISPPSKMILTPRRKIGKHLGGLLFDIVKYNFFNSTNVTVTCRSLTRFTLNGTSEWDDEALFSLESSPVTVDGMYVAEITVTIFNGTRIRVLCIHESGYNMTTSLWGYRVDQNPFRPPRYNVLAISRQAKSFKCPKHTQRSPCKSPQECNMFPSVYSRFWNTVPSMTELQMLDSIRSDYLGSWILCDEYEATFVRGLNGELYDKIEDAPDAAKLVISKQKNTPEGFYANGTFTFTCTGHLFFTGGQVLWFTNSSSGQLLRIENASEVILTKIGVIESSVNITLRKDMTQIICAAPAWKTEKWVKVVLSLVTLKDPILPKLEGSEEEVSHFKVDEDATLHCIIEKSLPLAKIRFERLLVNDTCCTWDKLELGIGSDNVRVPKQGRILAACTNCFYRGTLAFLPFKPEHSGKYRCIAESILGMSIKTYEVKVDTSLSRTWIVYVAIGVGVIVVLVAGTLTFRTRSQFQAIKKKLYLTEEDIRIFRDGLPSPSSSDNSPVRDPHSLPFPKCYEIPLNSLHINTNKILGTGEFGVVFMATLDTVDGDLAVKTVKPGKSVEYVRSLMSEIKVMTFIGRHAHIVNFVGACTQELQKGILYLINEYCTLGGLDQYLRGIERPCRLYYDPSADYKNIQTPASNYQNLSLDAVAGPLMRWTYQVADAMSFISSKNVIHADLATRNVLLTSDLIAKVTDFGLSRKLYQYSEYVKKSQEPLPWRWMAPESLQKLEFTTKSDVWSFGIFMWEVFEFGGIPYPGLSWDIDFVTHLLNGLRPPKPEFASNEMYTVLMSCCENEPGKRPDFDSIKKLIRGNMRNARVDLSGPLTPNADNAGPRYTICPTASSSVYMSLIME